MRHVSVLVCALVGWVTAPAFAAAPAGPATKPAAGEVRRFVADGDAAVRSAAFSPDGRLVLSVDHLPYKRGVVRLWDVATGRELRKWLPDETEPHGFDPRGAAFSPDGRHVLAFGWGDDAMRLWDAGTGELVRRFAGGERGAMAAAFSPDGRRVATGFAGEYRIEPSATLAMWDVGTGQQVHDFKGINVRAAEAVAFTPDGRKVIAGTTGGLCVFDAETGEFESKLPGPTCYRISISPDGARALTCGTGAPDLWDLKAGKVVRELTWKPGSNPERPDFAKGAEAIDAVFLPGPGGEDRAVTAAVKGPIVWDLKTGQPLYRLKGHARDAVHVAVSPDRRTALTFAEDGTIHLWDITQNP